jgi:hypothetical protein
MDAKYDSSPELANQKLTYWKLSLGPRTADSSMGKRDCIPVQPYVGDEIIKVTTKKRTLALTKQQRG